MTGCIEQDGVRDNKLIQKNSNNTITTRNKFSKWHLPRIFERYVLFVQLKHMWSMWFAVAVNNMYCLQYINMWKYKAEIDT